jgi:exodeoxyribonuclease-1
VVAPLSVLREQDRQRLQLDWAQCQRNAEALKAAQALWQDKLAAVYREEAFAASGDPEQQLYDGFIGDRDRRLCEQVRRAEPEALASQDWPFDDARLPELLFRYRARNFPDSLSPAERQRWQEFCRQRLSAAEFGAPNTLGQFRQALDEVRGNCTPSQVQLLQQWQAYAEDVQARYGIH